MENSPVVPGSPYFIMTYDTAKKLTGITEQTVFGSISLMNMLMVDFQNRKREFGLLKAVGATQKQLKSMLDREIGSYLGGSLLVSLAFGGLISIAACQRLDAVNHCISLKLPWLFLIALVAVMGGIYLIFVAYAKVELKKAEILPAIREE